MANYVALNAKYYKNKDYKKIMDHDFRLSEIDYLLKNSKYNNFFIEFEKFEDLKQKKEQILKKKGTKEQEKENTLIEFVCALSREETEKILNEKDGQLKLQNALKLTMEEISKKYGFTSIFYVFHADEGHNKNGENFNNFHAHLLFYNFDFKKEKSVLRNIKKDEWGKMQDLAANCFQKCGLNYIRGEKKTETERKHLERLELIKTIENKEPLFDKNIYIKNALKYIKENNINNDQLFKSIKIVINNALKYIPENLKNDITDYQKNKNIFKDNLKNEQLKEFNLLLKNIENLENELNLKNFNNEIMLKNITALKEKNITLIENLSNMENELKELKEKYIPEEISELEEVSEIKKNFNNSYSFRR